MAHRSLGQGSGVGGAGSGHSCFRSHPQLRAMEEVISNRLGLRAVGVFSRRVTGRDPVSEVVLPRTPDRIRSILHTQPGVAEPSWFSLTSGLAVDYHNERLYWADAKLSVIGSIRLNGTDPIVAADSKRGQKGGGVAPRPATRPPTLPIKAQ